MHAAACKPSRDAVSLAAPSNRLSARLGNRSTVCASRLAWHRSLTMRTSLAVLIVAYFQSETDDLSARLEYLEKKILGASGKEPR